ncbi:hypothetical protein GE107_24805 [Cohnella sp. CFH 77786]|nr:Gfo/Idh/MocA family oxidoreductase [Cohnella sp. CFH 77786]MBW5449250.1 hypothetical protein [Cohnella sp. CFH 77786]
MKLGFIGCGGISDAHLRGIFELRMEGRLALEITAVCDIDINRAEAFAAKVREQLQVKPAVYADYREMLAQGNLDAVTVLVTHDLHHTVAEDCFAAGLHVQMQKPLAISPSFGRKMIKDAARYGRVLTVSEPSVLGADNAATARAIRDGAIGPVRLVLDYATSAVGNGFFAGTPWRHMKGIAGAGWINDHGVHRTHAFLEMVGGIHEVFAYTDIYEKVRSAGGITIEPTGEDAAVTVFRFQNGALGHWMCATAVHAEGMGGLYIYGSQGCLRPGHHLALAGGERIPIGELVRKYAPEVPGDPFAHAYLELWEAVAEGKPPISGGVEGQEALCVVFAALESGHTGRPVKIDEIRDGRSRAYEETVIEEMQAQGSSSFQVSDILARCRVVSRYDDVALLDDDPSTALYATGTVADRIRIGIGVDAGRHY